MKIGCPPLSNEIEHDYDVSLSLTLERLNDRSQKVERIQSQGKTHKREREKEREQSEVLVWQCLASTHSSHVSLASVELQQAAGQGLFHMKVFQMLPESVYIFCYVL